MKKPKRLIGFVEHDNIEYSFEFVEQSFSLQLYPPITDVWKEGNNLLRSFNLLNKTLKA
jgi:hypothetical protein